MKTSHVFLNLKDLPTHTIFCLQHNEVSVMCRVEGWFMDYEKRISNVTGHVEQPVNMNSNTHHLIGELKCIALDFTFSSVVPSNLIPSLSTTAIINLIEANRINQETEEGEPNEVKCLIVQNSGGSSYYVFPYSLHIEDSLGTSMLISNKDIPPILKQPVKGGRLIFWFRDKLVFSKDNPSYII
jgi:hypothetical protein